MQKVVEGGMLPRGFSYTAYSSPRMRYYMLWFRWEGKQRRNGTHDLYISPGVTAGVGFSLMGNRPRLHTIHHFYYNCNSRQAV